MIRTGALVSYRNQPAIVEEAGTKLTIKTETGADRKVREKDVVLIHPGPAPSLSALGPREGEIDTAWEMLAGSVVRLDELCELAYGEYTPETAWGAWLLVQEGRLFEGDPERVCARSSEAVEEADRQEAERRRLEERKRELLDRIKRGRIEEEDRSLIGDVDALARGVSEQSKTLRDLGIREEPERAHGLLLRLGVWDTRENPYPSRFGVATRSPSSEGFPPPDHEDRKDLTGFDAHAIDDAWTTAADDAVSFADDGLWVHVADPAAAIPPGSELDEVARERGASLHAPERVAHMVPEELIERYSLGNDERSPALSFHIAVDASGKATLVEAVPSWVRVTRHTYADADLLLGDGDLSMIAEVCRRFGNRRSLHAAPAIELPEVRVTVDEHGAIDIGPIHSGPSRNVVLESMLMTGEAVADYAVKHELALPFSRQEEPDLTEAPATLSGMWAARRRFKRSEHSVYPGAHAGLGLPYYVQSTSPLRRYLDLLAHQQIRAAVTGGTPRDRDELTEAIAASDLRSAAVRRAEQLSNRHFTLAYLLDSPDWSGEAVVVSRGKHTTVIVPDLGLETDLVSREAYELDESVEVAVETIRLPTLECTLDPR